MRLSFLFYKTHLIIPTSEGLCELKGIMPLKHFHEDGSTVNCSISAALLCAMLWFLHIENPLKKISGNSIAFLCSDTGHVQVLILQYFLQLYF